MILKKRITALTLALILIFSSLSFRLYTISCKSIYAVGTKNTLKSNEISTTRGNIYDRNLKKFTNTKENYILCIKPTKESFLKIKELENYNTIEAELKKGHLVTTKIDKSKKFKNDNNMITLTTYERYESNSLCHILGYCDENGGVYGIEKHFDKYLKENSGTLTLKYHCDALGRVLNGEAVEVNSMNYNSNSGIVLTIDKEIQEITESALKNHNITKGAAIVLDTKTSEILACASLPEFNRSNLEEALKNSDSPFINRAFSSYAVGSVFKVVTASVAIEEGKSDLIYECKGSIEKSDTTFNCNKKEGHEKLDLKNALTVSCNPYFIELSCKIPKDKLLKTAEALGFNKATDFGNQFKTDKGNLPKEAELNSDAAIGNLGFGQGSLLATPLQIANCYATIVNGGIYNEPRLIKGYLDKENHLTKVKVSDGKRVLKNETCDILREYLFNVVENGTGKTAKSTLLKSGGKTATAETGQIDKNGVEISHSWFVGFFPYENPKYVICIMKENGVSGSIDCAPVFKEIGEALFLHQALPQFSRYGS